MISLAEQSSEAQEWSEWIEWKGGECPIPDAKAGEYQVKRTPRFNPMIPDYCVDIDAKHLAGWTDSIFAAYRLLNPTKDVTGEWKADMHAAWVGGTLQILEEQEQRWLDWPHVPAISRPSFELERRRYRRNPSKLDQPAKSEESRFAKIRVMEGSGACIKPAICDPNAAMRVRDLDGAKPTRIRPNIPGTPADLAAILAMCDRLDRMGLDQAFAAATMVDPVFTHRLGRFGA